MHSQRSTVRDLRRRNRSVLLSMLYFDGPLSRYELGSRTGLSPATVSTLTGELVQDGLVVEAGQVDSDGGRPRVLLRVNPGYGSVVGVDVGETGIRVELFALDMTRRAAVDHPLPSAGPSGSTVSVSGASGAGSGAASGAASVAALVAAGVREVMDEAGAAHDDVLGVGIGVPGTVEQGLTAVVHAETMGWDAVPLEDLVRACGVTLPLYVENGAKTQGQAEMWFGAGRGAGHAIIALIGSGVGAAVVSGGSIYRGATSSAGEWGHTTIVYGGRRCRCGSRGCLEAYVGAEAIIDRYHAAGGPPLTGADEQAQLDELVAAADGSAADGSVVAAEVLDETAGYLGAGIAGLVNLFNPERFVVGGWAGLVLGARMLPRITEATAAHALRHPYRQLSVQLGQVGADAVAVGAATLPVAALLERGADPRRRAPTGADVA